MFAGALVLAASLTQSAPASPPSDSVRVQFSAAKSKIPGRLWARRGGGEAYSIVCTSPCTADIAVGTPLRVTLLEHDEEPYDFTLTSDRGRDIELIARRGGRGAVAGGIVMTAVGGVTALVGVILAAISLADIPNQSSIRTAGFITLGIGGGLTIGGIAVLSGRTWEPSVKQVPFQNGRAATLPLPVAATPFSLTFTF